MRKILSVFLSVLMIFSTVFVSPVFAASAPQVLYSEDFDAYDQDSEGPKNIKITTGGLAKIVENGASNRALAYDLNLSSGTLSIPFSATANQIWFSAQFKIYGSLETASLFQISDANGNQVSTLNIDRDGSKLHNGKIISLMSSQKWFQVDVMLNVSKKTYDVYVDGIRKAKNVLITTDLNTPANLSFSFANNSQITVLYMDNLKIYEGSVRDETMVFGTNNSTFTGGGTIIEDNKATDIYLYENYDFPGTLASKGDSAHGSRDVVIGDNKIYYNMKSPDRFLCYLQQLFDIKPVTEEKVVIDCEYQVMELDRSGSATLLVIYDKNGTYKTIATVDGKGMNSTIPGIRTGQWVRISFAFDFATNTYDVYVDGGLELKGLSIGGTFGQLDKLRIGVTNGEINIDNLAVYEGEKPLESLSNRNMFNKEQSRFDDVTDRVLEFIGDNAVASLDTNAVYVNGKRYQKNEPGYLVSGSAVFSLKILAEAFGLNCVYEGERVTIGDMFVLTDGSDVILKNGEVVKADCTTEKQEDGDFYVPLLSFVKTVLGKQVVYDETLGLLFMNDTTPTVSLTDTAMLDNVLHFMTYDRMNGETMLQSIRERYPAQAHPRLSLTADKVTQIKEKLASNDEFYQLQMSNLMQFINTTMAAEPVGFTFRPGNSGTSAGIASCRLMENRIMSLAFMYQITGEEKYAERAWKEIEEICNFPYFPTGNPLDTGALVLGLTYGYDWLYDYLDDTQQKLIRDTIYEKCYLEYRKEYAGIVQDRGFQWVDAEINWNPVAQGPLVLAAMMMVDDEDYEEDCKYIFENGTRGLEYIFDMYQANDGASPESTSYWSYTMLYLSKVIDGVVTALGTDLGYTRSSGFKNSVNGYLATEGAGGTFNYHDSGGTKVKTSRSYPKATENGYGVFLLSSLYNQPAQHLSWKNMLQNSGMTEAQQPFNLIWYDPELIETGTAGRAVYSDYFLLGENIELVAMNGYANDENAMYLAYNAGPNYENHSHIDGGTFVLQSQGTTWIDDLGSEDYAVKGSNNNPVAYRIRPEGHNVFLINPRDGYIGQSNFGTASTLEYESKEQGAYALLDMSDLYSMDAGRATRGYKLTENRTSAVIRDEITLKKYSNILWFAHTMADIEIIDDHTAYLKRDGKTMKVTVDTNAETCSLKVMKAEPLPTSPKNVAGARSNEEWRKLAIDLTAAGTVYINVKFTPVYEENQNILSDNNALDDWKISDETETNPYINSIRIAGQELIAFDKYNTLLSFAVSDGETKHIEADADDRFAVEISDGNLWKDGLVKVYEKENPDNVTYYVVQFTPMAQEVQKPISVSLPILSVSSIRLKQDVTSIVTDRDTDKAVTVNEMNSQFIIDLGQVQDISSVAISFANPDLTYLFNLEYSEDGINYSGELNIHSALGKSELQRFTTGGVRARYIRLTANGNLCSYYFHFTELYVER